MLFTFWSLCFSTLLFPWPSSALLPATLPPHPRILLTDARVEELQGQLATNADLQLGYSYLQRYVDYLMPLPALRCKPFEPDRSSQAYPMLTRILSLGAVYRLTNNASVGRRAVSELLNLTTDPAWGWGTDPHEEGWIMHAYAPLSSGAMMLAASLGVDWLYPLLTPGELAAVVNSTLVLGLAPFACCFSASDPPPGPPPLFPPCLYLDWCGFPAFHNNWSPVLASMSILGGVALAGEEGVPTPWVDATLVSGGVATFPLGLGEFSGDGLYAESVEYGGYVHQFLAPVLAALPYVAPANASSDVYTALPGACLPLVHWGTLASFSHATGMGYNWCDADPASDTSQMLSAGVAYFAGRAGSPGAAYFTRRMALDSLPASLARAVSGQDDSRENLVNFLLFFSPTGTLQDYAATPRDLAFLSKQAFAVRGGEAFGGGAGDTFFAAKGLDGQDQRGPSDHACQAVDHNHMDAGSFVWDMGGGRFAGDLGYENYGVLGYFDPKIRYTYYRASTAGHNTLQIDGLGQAPCTWANFTSINSTDGMALGGRWGGGGGGGGGVVCAQEPMADPPSASSTTTAQFWAVLNLTDVYAPAFNASGSDVGGGGGGGGGHTSPPPPLLVQRGFLALDERATFATVDEFPSGLARHNITWRLHINGSAVVGSSGHTVTLTTSTSSAAAATTGAATSQAALAINTHPSATDAGCLGGGAFAVHPLVLDPVPGGPGRQQLNTTGITVVQFVIDPASGSGSGSECGRLTVVMGGVGILGTPPTFPVKPLAQWGGSGPLGEAAAPALAATAAVVDKPAPASITANAGAH